MADAIPIQNLYYLFCYAWRHYREGALVDVGRVENPTLPNLFATVLIQGVPRLLKRGLDRDYVDQEDDLRCLRGKINVSETVKRTLLLDRKAACTFDEFQVDIVPNQILKATMRTLIRTAGLDGDLRGHLTRLCREFAPISDIPLSRAMFRQVRIHRNNRFYHFLMRVCEFVHDAILPETAGKHSRFSDILRDEKKMARVFEEFVRNFYAAEQTEFRVKRDRFAWQGFALSPGAETYLPHMETDITLRSHNQTIIIDTKYTPHVLQEHFGSRTIQSPHLYQLFAYVKNLVNRTTDLTQVAGILLYPTVGESLRLTYEIQGHKIQIATIDLAQDWQQIREELLALLTPVSASGPVAHLP